MKGLLKLFVLLPRFEKRFFYAAPLMDSLDQWFPTYFDAFLP